MAEQYLQITNSKVGTVQVPTKATFTKYLPIYRTVTLSTSGWNSSSKTQTVTVQGVLANETAQKITPMPKISSMSAYNAAGIQCTNQAANSLTFTCQTIPTAALTVYVVIEALYS